MNFDKAIEEGKVKKIKPDKELTRSILRGVKEDLKFLQTLPLNQQSVRRLVVNYYDLLRSCLEAMALLDGYKIYMHEAYTPYLKEIKQRHQDAERFDRLRRLRNAINYYGREVEMEEAKERVKEMERMILNILEELSFVFD